MAVDFGGGERILSGIGGRHALRRVGGGDAAHNLAALGVVRDDGEAAFTQIGLGAGFLVQAQRDFSGWLYRARGRSSSDRTGWGGYRD